MEPANENVWNKQSAVVTSCWSFYRAESHKCPCWMTADNLPVNDRKILFMLDLEIREPKI